jgi:hypothetical protein
MYIFRFPGSAIRTLRSLENWRACIGSWSIWKLADDIFNRREKTFSHLATGLQWAAKAQSDGSSLALEACSSRAADGQPLLQLAESCNQFRSHQRHSEIVQHSQPLSLFEHCQIITSYKCLKCWYVVYPMCLLFSSLPLLFLSSSSPLLFSSLPLFFFSAWLLQFLFPCLSYIL